jgi:uncharacterized protein (UPF0332 family)
VDKVVKFKNRQDDRDRRIQVWFFPLFSYFYVVVHIFFVYLGVFNLVQLIIVAKMPVIANKSDFNLQAAEELIKKDLYAPSVHCSYYGCFQKMKSILSQRLSVSYEKIDNTVKTHTQSEHTFIRDVILQDLIGKLDNNILRKLGTHIKSLYRFRINADYKDLEIRNDTANEAMRISNEVVLQLKKVYKL